MNKDVLLNQDQQVAAEASVLQPCVSLTPHQICEMGLKYGMTNRERFFYELGISDVEAAHGITAATPNK
jgi:hypothetical protein